MLSYWLCSTPRTGSTLLCSLLTSSGVAGRPESYFRAEDTATWASRWAVNPDDEDEFLRAAIRAGTTPNGVFGARVMWGTGIIGHLDHSVLFGERRRFVFLRRTDTLAQAVSWTRAEQTGYWQSGDTSSGSARFDRPRLDQIMATIAEHNAAWSAWFAERGIVPYEVSYEALAGEPDPVVRGVLEYLGVDTAAPLSSTVRRQADRTNTDWVRRYTNDGQGG